MTSRSSRRDFIRTGAAGIAFGLAGCTGGGSGEEGGSSDGGSGSGDGRTESGPPAWRTATLTDVRTGEEFTVGGFDRPVLLETFAVWCPTCRRQQDKITELHERVGEDVVPVSLDTDPNEDAEKVREYVERHGYDWRYAISPPAVTRSLTTQFGQSIAQPPNAPMVLVCPDGGARRLRDGVKPASELAQEVEAGC